MPDAPKPPPQRGSLNRLLFAVFVATAWVNGGVAPGHEPGLGFALAAALVLAAMLTARWRKLSLHVAFATYAACLLWPFGWPAVLAGLALSAAVAWSRLSLSRHVPRDLVAGALGGAGAGLAYWHVVSRWPG